MLEKKPDTADINHWMGREWDKRWLLDLHMVIKSQKLNTVFPIFNTHLVLMMRIQCNFSRFYQIVGRKWMIHIFRWYWKCHKNHPHLHTEIVFNHKYQKKPIHLMNFIISMYHMDYFLVFFVFFFILIWKKKTEKLKLKSPH